MQLLALLGLLPPIQFLDGIDERWVGSKEHEQLMDHEDH